MKALVLLSGGMDSTTCLHIAIQQYGAAHVGAISIDYGQRHKQESEYAAATCKRLGIPLRVVPLGAQPKSILTDETQEVPDISYDEIEGISPTYVPFRNGQLLALIAAWAQAEEVEAIYFGAHAEDAENWAYPDCTPEFIGAMANAIFIGTYQKTRLITPLMWMDKTQVVLRGQNLGVHWEDTWSCYKGGEKHCGTCPTCISRSEAFHNALIFDPTIYEASHG